MILRLAAAVVTAAATAAVATGCGDDVGSGDVAKAIAIEHVHGLGVNPADDALYVATHDGLLRVEPGSGAVATVGETKKDTMGFTVLQPDQFLGSGHPGRGEGGPRSLGLIASDDGGRSWENVSLSGKADLHILRYGSGRIYAVDALTRQLLVSDDEGRNWKHRKAPGGLIDLAPDPADPNHVLAATQSGLLESPDGGARWRRIGPDVGLLSWPDPGRLFLVNAAGLAQSSGDGGLSWQALGVIGAQPSAFVADDLTHLYAARVDGTLLASDDGGVNWTELAPGDS